MIELIHLHCKSLPHRLSHYSREKTSLNYFDDSSLNVKRLYDSFVDYYKAIKDEEPPISEKTCPFF